MIWSDGTNYQAFVFRGDLGTAAVRSDTDFVRTDASQSFSTLVLSQLQKNAGLPAAMRGYIDGLILSLDGTAYFGISQGSTTDSTNVDVMRLTSAYTKAYTAWAVGTAQGCLDTGSATSSTFYHVFLIKRPDTGVSDVLMSLSATAPTLPTNYTLFRRIGSVRYGSGTFYKESRVGDEVLYDVTIPEVSTSNLTTTVYTLAGVPAAVPVTALLRGYCTHASAGVGFLVTCPTLANTISGGNLSGIVPAAGGYAAFDIAVRTNTSAQIKFTVAFSNLSLTMDCYGYVDLRGKNA